MSLEQMSLNWLKQNHTMVHYFGLGFIQLKLGPTQRMHFYAEELPPITPEEDIHNHRYDFTSRVLKGSLKQEIFQITSGDTHVLESESCKEGVRANDSPKKCGIYRTSIHRYTEGSVYTIQHDTFHRVAAVDCITHLTRTEYKKDFAQVVRPAGSEKVCPFSQKVDDETLWKIIDRMLRM